MAQKMTVTSTNAKTGVKSTWTVAQKGKEHVSSVNRKTYTVTVWESCNPLNISAMVQGALKAKVSRYEVVDK